ncbi:N-acetylneuraminate synthase family protein [Neptuniibacter sp. QD29_5]|uniref:N-acetylneuraminate synthase family protein n=1 Tax=Neptuniibacter sp. QD29_5 TaxID=3398207 RepID=UPI0039F5567B
MLKVKIIAELGNTHEGSVGLAKCMIKAASDAGADVAKLQTHIFEAESLESAPNPPYFSSETRKEYFDRTSFNREQYLELISYADSIGIELISSPFSVEALDFLISLGMTIVKIPSGEVSNHLLLNAIAKNDGLDVILSSGMSSIDELDEAVDILKSNPSNTLQLLQCTSEYPCPPQNVGLEKIKEFGDRYNVSVGFSDHTLSEAIPALAVYAGAIIVEKHFTLSKQAYGSDAKHSLEPEEFSRMVKYIREAETVLQSRVDKATDTVYIANMKQTFEKSLVYKASLDRDHVLCYDDFAAKKPGDGIATKSYTDFIGKKLKKSVVKDQPVSFTDI